MRFFKKHTFIPAIIIFLFFTVPSAINAYWSLYEKFRNVSMPSLNLGVWVWLLPLVGAVLAIIIIWQGRRNNSPSRREKQGSEKGVNIQEKIVIQTKDILINLHECSIKLKNKSVKQFIKLFTFRDFWEITNNIAYAMKEHKELLNSVKKDFRGRKLSKDRVKKRQQIDNVFDKFSPIMQEDMNLEKIVVYANYWEDFPREQNPKYKGILGLRKIDSRWNKLFNQLNKIKMEYPKVFVDEPLNKLINEYLDSDFGGCNIYLVTELFSHFVTVENQPSEYIKSGANNPIVKIENRMTKILVEIENRIKEIVKPELSIPEKDI